jgi:prophage regulatory protein
MDESVSRALRLPDVEHLSGLRRSAIYKLESEGRFPKRVKLTERSSAWLEHEVRGWLAARVAERTAA